MSHRWLDIQLDAAWQEIKNNDFIEADEKYQQERYNRLFNDIGFLWREYDASTSSSEDAYRAPEMYEHLKQRTINILLEMAAHMSTPVAVHETMFPKRQPFDDDDEASMERQNTELSAQSFQEEPPQIFPDLAKHFHLQNKIRSDIHLIVRFIDAQQQMDDDADEEHEEMEVIDDDGEDTVLCAYEEDEDDKLNDLLEVADEVTDHLIKVFNEAYNRLNISWGEKLQESCRALGTFVLPFNENFGVGTKQVNNVKQYVLTPIEQYKATYGDRAWYFDPYGGWVDEQ